jgi:tetratricopeptide (TPR) repeat protein
VTYEDLSRPYTLVCILYHLLSVVRRVIEILYTDLYRVSPCMLYAASHIYLLDPPDFLLVCVGRLSNLEAVQISLNRREKVRVLQDPPRVLLIVYVSRPGSLRLSTAEHIFESKLLQPYSSVLSRKIISSLSRYLLPIRGHQRAESNSTRLNSTQLNLSKASYPSQSRLIDGMNFKTYINPSASTTTGISEAIALNNRAQQLSSIGDHEGAAQLHRQAITIKITAHGANSFQVAISRNALGEELLRLGRLEEAEEELKEAVRIREEAPPENAFDAAVSRENLAQVYEVKKQWNDARQIRFRNKDQMVCSNYEVSS